MRTTRRWGVIALVAIAAIIASIIGASSAGAYPAGTAAGITTSTNTVPQGGSLTVNGSNFLPNSGVNLTLHSAGVFIGSATVGSNGSFSVGVTIPADTAPGSHTITATDANGESASTSITVTAAPVTPAPPGGLAGTGVAVIGIGALGLVLLVGGGLMLLAGRRRRTSAV